jgi:pyrimidine-nucleoside phosphorylase/thymidine phosphorylase
MRAVDTIIRKRDGHALSQGEIASFVQGLSDGTWQDYQVSALLMAIVLNGMSPAETVALTTAMLRSGERVDLSDVPGFKVGKHSTGGVGDKVSIALAPIVAACGVVLPKMSGRGLGHTGGTLDKVESIPGFRVGLSIDEFKGVLRTVGTCIIGQTTTLAPADKTLYALRDVTGTVESLPLIAASIMSKKLAEGSSAVVLDVKCGNGAFMKDVAEARGLAEAMTAIGAAAGVPTECVITAMDQPLGEAVGNALEIKECLALLTGRGPAEAMDVVRVIASRMVALGGAAPDAGSALGLVERAVSSGDALETFRRMVEAQGGDPRVVDDPHRLPSVAGTHVVHASADGYVSRMHALSIGRASICLGAGRDRVGDAVDHAVGLLVKAHVGDRVEAGQPLLELHHRDGKGLTEAVALCRDAWTISDTPVPRPPKVLDVVT